MIAARSAQETLVSCTNGSASAITRAYEPLSTVAGVASNPTRPLRVAATACTAPGCTTPSTSTPSVVCISRSRSAGSAAAVPVAPGRVLHQPLAQRRERRGGRGVAGHDEQLHVAGDQLLRDLQRER